VFTGSDFAGKHGWEIVPMAGLASVRSSSARNGRPRRQPGAAVQLVVTPGSGEGRAMATARRLRRMLERRGHVVELRAFADLAALTQWADSCPPGASYIVGLGGDTTMSAAARAAIRGNTPFIPVPNGFGNVFAQVFGYSSQAGAALRLLAEGELRAVDVGELKRGTSRDVFLSHRSYGFLAQIQQIAERGRKQPRRRLLRYLWYVGVAWRFLIRTGMASFQVEVDGKPVADDAVLVTVANVETYRGFLTLTPTASPIDGLLDVFLVPRVSKAGLMLRLVRLMFRLPGRWRGVSVHRGRRVTVTAPWGRDTLIARRRVLPLLVPPGAIEALRLRTIEGDAPIDGA
jgi:diacylglycerol kinase family enzyme